MELTDFTGLIFYKEMLWIYLYMNAYEYEYLWIFYKEMLWIYEYIHMAGYNPQGRKESDTTEVT